MRIELPSATWDPAALRADEDAHTLTVAPQPALDWPSVAPWGLEPGVPLRAQVPEQALPTLTITF
jgi:hypothetical protein